MTKDGIKKGVFCLLGLLVSVLPVSIAVISYFPVWRERGGAALLSAFALILIFIAAIPLFRIIGGALKSPASYTVWLILFVLFFLLSKIADEMVVISFIGFISNLVGAVFFRLGKRKKEE